VCLVCKRGMGRMSTGESAVSRDEISNPKRKVRGWLKYVDRLVVLKVVVRGVHY